MRRLVGLVVPDGLLLLAAVVLVRWKGGAASPQTALALQYAPLLILAAGLVLSWRFHRGRLLFAMLVLALTGRALELVGPGGAGGSGMLVLDTVAMLLPLNLLGFAVAADRGVVTPGGLTRLAVLGAQAGAVLLLALAMPAGAERAFELQLLPDALDAWTSLPHLAVVLFAVAFLAMLARALWRPDPIARGLLWALVASYLAVDAIAAPAGIVSPATVYLGVGALALTIAAVESAYAMAFRDELTSLPSRRALLDLMRTLDDRYVLAMVDVDHFKQFNDRHGHDVGDQVLRMVAARLDDVGGGGRAFRYGGEEFTVVFPGRSLEEAVPHLEALRQGIAGATFTVRGKDRPRRRAKGVAKRGTTSRSRALRVTVSIGAASPNRDATPDAVLTAADKALYRAKEAGRNQVAVAGG